MTLRIINGTLQADGGTYTILDGGLQVMPPSGGIATITTTLAGISQVFTDSESEPSHIVTSLVGISQSFHVALPEFGAITTHLGGISQVIADFESPTAYDWHTRLSGVSQAAVATEVFTTATITTLGGISQTIVIDELAKGPIVQHLAGISQVLHATEWSKGTIVTTLGGIKQLINAQQPVAPGPSVGTFYSWWFLGT